VVAGCDEPGAASRCPRPPARRWARLGAEIGWRSDDVARGRDLILDDSTGDEFSGGPTREHRPGRREVGSGGG